MEGEPTGSPPYCSLSGVEGTETDFQVLELVIPMNNRDQK